MINNQWYVVLDSKEIKREKITAVKRLSKDLLFWRDTSDKIHCIERTCAHRGADLALGKIVNDHVQCPFHGIEYDGSGKAVLIPSIGKNGIVRSNFKVKSYPVIEKGDFVFMWFGEGEKDLPEIKWLEGIDKTFNYSSLTDIWPVHYSRSIENQLDVSHLPFVHYNTIGRGGKTLVNGPIVEYKDMIMNVWVNNVLDNGQRPLKPEEVKKVECRGRLQFIFPNYWQNIINDDLRVVAAFVPDDSNTIIYLRFYQRFLKIPLIQNLVTKISMPLNKKILNQDKRVVLTQKPIKSELKMNENLYQGDLPIIIYRRVREELKSAKEVSE
jgi:phenylpropionate dioxygenase-like ring-hydroxylating dioxygenase large terminal subunit